ncbi:MAG: hypothetical protein ACEQSA_04730 [Weeksellaceae bacterium]
MNKQIYILIIFMMLLSITPVVDAQTRVPTPRTASPSASVIDEEVDKLKERVAEKVAELKGSTQQAVSGMITKISDKTLTIAKDKKTNTVSLDETLTKYYSIQGTAAREIKKADLAANDYVFVIGPQIDNTVTANQVYRDQRYLTLTGKITQVNADDYTVTIVTLEKNQYTLDLQTRSQQLILNIETLETEKVGFSKFKEGDSVHVIVKKDNANDAQTRYDVEKILIIPNEYFLQ